MILPSHFEAIGRAVAKLNSDIEKMADELVTKMPAAKLLTPSVNAQHALENAIANFTMLIPEMMVIGTLLEQSTSA